MSEVSTLYAPEVIRDALLALCREVGPRAYASISITVQRGRGDDKLLSICLYPFDITGTDEARRRGLTGSMHEYGNDPIELVAKLRARWQAEAHAYAEQVVTEMAKAVLDAAYAGGSGSVPAAALRAQFDPDDVRRYGAQAAVRANVMAAGGPFSVDFSGSDNGAPADAEEDDA